MAENTSSKKSYGAVDDNKDEMAIEIQKLKLNSKTIQENKLPSDDDEKKSLLSNNNEDQASSSSSSSDVKKEDESENSSTLVWSFLLMVFFQLGNRIFGRLETYPMHNYPMFMNILSVIMYIPLSFAYIIPVILLTDWITPEQRKIPQYKFMVMGGLDSIAGIMAMFAINYIPNASMIVLVQQSAIPISMAISSSSLGARYTRSQYTGAGVVLLGILAVLIPEILKDSISSGSTTDGSDSSDTDTASSTTGPNYPGSSQMLWYSILVLSCIPMVLSSVYKEKELGELEIDVVYLNGWIAVWQFIFAIPLCIPSAYVINMPLEDIMPNMQNGLKCYFGHNSIGVDELLAPDDCSMSLFYVTTYLGFNLVYNILMIVILKHGSSNILWLASTIIVPLSNIAFSLKIMPGHQPMTMMDNVGLIIIMAGLVIYRFTNKLMDLCPSALSDEETKAALAAKEILQRTEQEQMKYVGFNQIEGLNALFDNRVMSAQRRYLKKSSGQIRGSLLARLGIPPSPFLEASPSGIAIRKNSLPGDSPLLRSPTRSKPGFSQLGPRRFSESEKHRMANMVIK